MSKLAFPLAVMQAAAAELEAILAPHVQRQMICGSVRRRKAQCSDIELVYQPLADVPTKVNLLGEASEWTNPTLDFLDSLIEDKVLSYRIKSDGTRTWGTQNRLAYFHHNGIRIPVDLFAVTKPQRWGTHIAVRTGSEDFNKKLLCRRCQGGWMPDNLRMLDGFGVFRHHEEIPCPTEEEFFRVMGIRWFDPEHRHAVSSRPWIGVALQETVGL